ncbi:MAG: TrkH family potassium uptake protein [Betaproteobacteria bacterium]
MMATLGPAAALLSKIVMAFACAKLVPLAWAIGGDQAEHMAVWLGSFLLTLGSGGLLWLKTKHYRRELLARDGFLLVNMVWLALPVYAAFPLLLTVPDITWSKAIFESISALTATGATALSGLDGLPVSTNVWRCFLQLIGGLGIVLLVVAVLPLLGLGGLQLYKAETPGPMKDTKFTPRIAETARGLWLVYFGFSVACMLAYKAAGMSWPDAFMHMCTTMGLGGFSSHDASFAYWDSLAIELVAMLFMALSGISFLRYFVVLRSLSLKPISSDYEIRAYLSLLMTASIVVTLILIIEEVESDWGKALRLASFHVVSLATTTGYASTDYALWPSFIPALLLVLGCFASCAGSTGGGIKMIRVLLLIKQARRELVRIIHPRVVNPVTLGQQTLPANVLTAVLGFMLIYGVSTLALSFVLLLTGMDYVTAVSAVVATLNNIGPGLGAVGPAGNFGQLNGLQLHVLSFAMLLGRLELLSVLVLFTAAFWRR